MKSAGDESADVMSAGPPIAFTYSDSYALTYCFTYYYSVTLLLFYFVHLSS